MLFLTVIKDKAQDAYAALSVEDCGVYHVKKAAILNAYELVPGAHRQKFRNKKKDDELMLNLHRHILIDGALQRNLTENMSNLMKTKLKFFVRWLY